MTNPGALLDLLRRGPGQPGLLTGQRGMLATPPEPTMEGRDPLAQLLAQFGQPQVEGPAPAPTSAATGKSGGTRNMLRTLLSDFLVAFGEGERGSGIPYSMRLRLQEQERQRQARQDKLAQLERESLQRYRQGQLDIQRQQEERLGRPPVDELSGEAELLDYISKRPELQPLAEKMFGQTKPAGPQPSAELQGYFQWILEGGQGGIEVYKRVMAKAERPEPQLIPGRDVPLPPNVAAQKVEMDKAIAQVRADVQASKPLSAKDTQTARDKLTKLRLARTQLGNLKDRWFGNKEKKISGVKGSLSAGPGQGYLPTPSGQAFDAAVDAMRQTITALTRVPGIGQMSDYETRLFQAQMPRRTVFENVTEQQLQQLEDMFNVLETGYGEMVKQTEGKKKLLVEGVDF